MTPYTVCATRVTIGVAVVHAEKAGRLETAGGGGSVVLRRHDGRSALLLDAEATGEVGSDCGLPGVPQH